MPFLRRKKSSVPTNKKVRNATPNEFDGIKFRSRLETFTYKRLKESGINADYERHKYTLLQSFDFHDEKVREWSYTPDFTNHYEETEDKSNKWEDLKWVIEIKGFANDRFPLTWKMFKSRLKALNKEETVKLFLVKNQKEVNEAIEIIKTL